jgi:hypothetical protein
VVLISPFYIASIVLVSTWGRWNIREDFTVLYDPVSIDLKNGVLYLGNATLISQTQTAMRIHSP